MFFLCFDLAMALIMFLIGLCFYRSEGKGAKLLSGYNMRSDQERKRFDEKKLCQCYGKRMMVMALPFLFGAALDQYRAGAGCILAWIIWIILFVLLMIKRTKMESKT